MMIGKGDQGGSRQLDGSGDTGQLEEIDRWNKDKEQIIIRKKTDTGLLEVG